MIIPKDKDESLIPPGPYCYHFVDDGGPRGCGMPILCCSYWERREGQLEQQDGYCHFLECGDWEEYGTFLLWDQVKCCGVNDSDYEPEEVDCQKIITWASKVLDFIRAFRGADTEYLNKVEGWIEKLKKE